MAFTGSTRQKYRRALQALRIAEIGLIAIRKDNTPIGFPPLKVARQAQHVLDLSAAARRGDSEAFVWLRRAEELLGE